MKTAKSHELFARARQCIPGGVNSPVRAFGSVGMEPRFIRSAKGATLTDADGNAYIDYVGSWGPMILGHADPDVLEAVERAARDGLSFGAPCEAEAAIAEAIVRLTGVDMVRMVNSGTEAVMSALRVARGFTGRDKVVKFAGCYHGHADSMLVKAGSGALTGGVPDSAGVSAAVAADTLTATYNDPASVEALLLRHPDSVAAVIVEPVAANMGVVPPADGFLSGLRALCDTFGALLIFDEVITGFRLGLGGAQAYYNVKADIATYGKIIGGGMPVGAYGGRRDVMEKVAPSGPVYQAGTLSGNPVAMAAGLAQLTKLEQMKDVFPRLEATTAKLADGLTRAAERAGRAVTVNRAGSLCCAFFTDGQVGNYDGAKRSDTGAYARYFASMLERGIYLAPSQFEAMFVSASHTDAMLDQTIAAAGEAFELG
ncbi:MAG: glutamate-1-semialdehyde 2,1-aminomutase [Planctomycetota bacterium]|jgi:glutamate-1-semialdehyde 2,1-aminomutase|nr:glutamate-1-semialdehyde 2,1-aminomutase [Planctomycetota bacterium]